MVSVLRKHTYSIKRTCFLRTFHGRGYLTVKPLIVAVLTLVAAPVAVGAQVLGETKIDLRLGATYSTALAEANVVISSADGSGEVAITEITPSIGPFIEVGIVHTFSPRVAAEAHLGGAFGSAEGDGPGGTWDAGDITTFSAKVGIRVFLRDWVFARGAIGILSYSADDVGLFDRGNDTGILIAGGAGVRLPIEFPLFLDVEVQRHGFGTPVLRAGGAADGAVLRFLVSLSTQLGVGR